MKKNFNIKINNKAFTLIEALVAISILMIAIASPMTLAQKGLSTASLSKDQMIAAFLAQDAIEAVRNIRDQIAVSQTGGDWLTGPTPTGFLRNCICDPSSPPGCSFDVTYPDKPSFCQIDTTSSNMSTTVELGGNTSPKLKISYTALDKNGVRHFLKYDYTGVNCDNQYVCDSKFSRYINIIRDPTNTNTNEAVVNVRVFWDSPLGTQKTDVQDFIYNYSENL